MKIIKSIIHFYFRILFQFRKRKYEEILIVDLDNTLANTWPSFLKENYSEKQRLLNLPVLKGTINVVKNYQKSEIFILTARPYRYYIPTKKWLISNLGNNLTLIMVDKVEQKLKFLKDKSKKIIYFDDLSYNHERGEIKFYQELIDKVRSLQNVQYFDYSEIKKINSEDH